MAHTLLATIVLLWINVFFISCHSVEHRQLLVRSAAQSYLYVHNQARAEVDVEPLKWSDTLANAASNVVTYQKINKGCQFANLSGGIYSANQGWSGSARKVPPRKAVSDWVAQKKYYNYANNSCAVGHDTCRVYTQVVWRKSMEVGCARALCVKEKSSLTICYYNPPGNYKGERPY